MDDHEYEDRGERRRAVRRWMFIGVLIVAVAVGIWGVYWVSQKLGLGRIGSFYEQADQPGK